MATAVKKWMSSRPVKCDLCSKVLLGVFIDGKTTFGPWGIMCVACHGTRGCDLGEGRGQLYDLQTLSKLEG